MHKWGKKWLTPRGGSLLQRPRQGRAVDQGRQVCLELDATVLPTFYPESGEVGSVCFGLQPGQFSAASGPSQKNQTWVPSQPIDQADQDRSEGGSAWPDRHVSDGRSRGKQGDMG